MKKKYVLFVGLAVFGPIVFFGFKIWDINQKRIAEKPLDGIKYIFERGDYAEVRRRVEPFVHNGNFFAQKELSRLYALGRGAPQDDNEAKKWLKLSTENLIKEYGDRDNCKGVEANYAQGIFAMAKEIQRLGEKDIAERWYKFASDLNYDPQKCPVSAF